MALVSRPVAAHLIPGRGLALDDGHGLGALDHATLALHVVVLHQVTECLPVLALVVAHVDEHVVEARELGPPVAILAVLVRLLHRAKEVEEKRIVLLMAREREMWCEAFGRVRERLVT